MEREELVEKYQDLFWYMNKTKLHKLNDEVIVEFILNYGSWEAFIDLKSVMGMEKLAKIFIQLNHTKKSNLQPKIRHYFNLLFRKHAPQCFK